MTKQFQMHIALLSAEYPPAPGGIGDYTQRLGAALTGQRLRVSVLTGERAGIASLDEQPPRVALDLAAWNWRCWWTVERAMRALQPDVLHIQYQTGAYAMHPAIDLLPWWLHRRSNRTPVAVTMHDLLEPYLFPKAGPLRGWVTRRLVRDSDAVVVTNIDDQARVQAAFGGRTPMLIPIGSNIEATPPPGYQREHWRAAHGVSPDTTLIAYFGLMSSSKGVNVLLAALAQLPARTRLVVIGGEATAPQDRAYATAVRQQVEALGLVERVLFTGHCDAAAVSAHLLAADIAALPFTDGASFRRGSLLAALAHGLPTVTTSAGRSELIDGEQVLLTPPGDVAALAAALARLEGDASLRARLARGGQALAQQFSWEHIAGAHAELYQQMTR